MSYITGIIFIYMMSMINVVNEITNKYIITWMGTIIQVYFRHEGNVRIYIC